MFVRNYPAMVVDKSLIITDLHLGITKELYDAGVFIPQQSKTLANKINKLKAMTKTKKLVILGDLKHKIPVISWQEYHEVPQFFQNIDFDNVVVTKGNHDGDLEKIILDTGKKVKVKNFHTAGGYAFTHGHMNIKTNKRTIVIGHNHTKILFTDEMGATYFEQVWVKGSTIYDKKERKIIIMPPFNELSGSFVINDTKLSDREHRNFRGPIAKNITNHRLYLLDSTDLGLVDDILASKRR